jgi:hypothetical protein
MGHALLGIVVMADHYRDKLKNAGSVLSARARNDGEYFK